MGEPHLREEVALPLSPLKGEIASTLEKLGAVSKLETFVLAFPVDQASKAKAVRGPTLAIGGGQLRLDLEIDPDDPISFDDLVILRGPKGYEEKLKVVSEGKAHTHAKGHTTLIFPRVTVGERYTCIVDPGREGPPYCLFKDMEIRKEHLHS